MSRWLSKNCANLIHKTLPCLIYSCFIYKLREKQTLMLIVRLENEEPNFMRQQASLLEDLVYNNDFSTCPDAVAVLFVRHLHLF